MLCALFSRLLIPHATYVKAMIVQCVYDTTTFVHHVSMIMAFGNPLFSFWLHPRYHISSMREYPSPPSHTPGTHLRTHTWYPPSHTPGTHPHTHLVPTLAHTWYPSSHTPGTHPLTHTWYPPSHTPGTHPRKYSSIECVWTTVDNSLWCVQYTTH
jgi:hypothetical protein